VNAVTRLRFLRYAVGFVGLLFTATIYPLVMGFGSSGGRWQINQGEQMLLGVYVTLGIFLLIASRNPLQHRSVIWFAVWSSVAHAAVMIVQSFTIPADRPDLLRGSGVLLIIAILLGVLMPRGAAAEPTAN
jgi:hypothetical protein